MNYYDELDIAPDASPEQIRKAFRGVTRMLHPDLQMDDQMRQLAAAQMRRLNEVMDTLCHPDKRLAYDQSLEARQYEMLPVFEPSPDGPGRTGAAQASVPALGAGLVLGSLAMYCVSVLVRPELEAAKRPPNEKRVVVTESRKAPAAERQIRQVASPAIQKKLQAEVPLPPPQPTTDAMPIAEAMVDAPPIERIAPVQPLPATRSAVAAQQPARRIEPRPLEGIWLYAADAKEKPARWAYAAEYVELRVQEREGEIVGAYRSRYKVPNRISQPEVTFRFRGPASSTAFEWQAAGARGTIQLQLQGDNVMEASWTVADSGNIHGLGAGSSTLIRRLN
ncbi:J domain-containing protein [Bryobacter aggregatus]|uniref:J domain-containing protein n=1 Tax=Bryobacter aggregatus TaxID=360054 RepID=UPI0004E10804|nr:DnaJ domain-containing protein [Bryobacter aggregatus]